MPQIPAPTNATPSQLTIGEKTYKLRMLDDSDRREFELWVQKKSFDIARQLAEGLPTADRQAILNHAIDKAATITFSSPVALTLISTPEGMARLLWMALRADHPDVGLKDVEAWVGDPAKLSAALPTALKLDPFTAGIAAQSGTAQ